MASDLSTEALEALLAGATRWPWEWVDEPTGVDCLRSACGAHVMDLGEHPSEPYYGGRAGEEPCEADEDLLALAPELAQEVLRLRGERDRMRRVLVRGAAMEARAGWVSCFGCNRPVRDGHAPDCDLVAILEDPDHE